MAGRKMVQEGHVEDHPSWDLNFCLRSKTTFLTKTPQGLGKAKDRSDKVGFEIRRSYSGLTDI